MPITPRFRLSQTSSQLIVTIHIPHIRVSVSTIELIVDGQEVHFYSSPYLLHLTFPGRLVDDESAEGSTTDREAKAVYDPSEENGMLTVTIYKEEEEIWPDLDLLGNLRNDYKPPLSSSKYRRNLIETVHESIEENGDKKPIQVEEDVESSDFTLNDAIQSQIRPHYGFLNMYHSVFDAYAREGLSHEMLELPQPDETLNEDRRSLRLETEEQKFSPERYLNDLFLSEADDQDGDMLYIEATTMIPHWQGNTESLQSSMATITHKMKAQSLSTQTADKSTEEDRSKRIIIDPDIIFSKEESSLLASTKAPIPHLSSISTEQTRSLLLSLMDILYAYAYDYRTTSADPSCESSWTIVTLSPTLSWFESYTPPYDDIVTVFRWCIRRSLSYPYLRNFHFVSRLLVQDVSEILSGGRRMILRSLLHVQQILHKSEFHYLFNKLYIDPIICWIQLLEEDVISLFAVDMKESIVKDALQKNTLGLNLDEIERDAFNDINLGEDSEDSDDSDDSDDSEEYSSDQSDDDDTSTSSSFLRPKEESINNHSSSANFKNSCMPLSTSQDSLSSEDVMRNKGEETKPSLLDDEIGCFESSKELLLRVNSSRHHSQDSTPTNLSVGGKMNCTPGKPLITEL